MNNSLFNVNDVPQTEPQQIITASAPTRICDNGGWTDTWFAQYGTIFNIAIEPRAYAQIKVWPVDSGQEKVIISAANFGDRYKRILNTPWQKHPLIEATIELIGLPAQRSVEIYLHSDAPPGASLGTSAAITVALIGALDGLTPGRLSAHEVAYLAQKVETDKLGGQCGIQDQLAAAYGGISYIDMFDYPYASVSPVGLSPTVWRELEERLLVIYMGRPHNSSEVHSMVIRHLEHAGPEEARLVALRQTARPAMQSLLAGNFDRFGQALIENTNRQADLHPDLVSQTSKTLIEVAQKYGAAGWKVNGAGGEGGSLAILTGRSLEKKRKLVEAIRQEFPSCSVIFPRLAKEGLVRHAR